MLEHCEFSVLRGKKSRTKNQSIVQSSLMASYFAAKQKTCYILDIFGSVVCSVSQVMYSLTYNNPQFVWSSFPRCCAEKKLLTCFFPFQPPSLVPSHPATECSPTSLVYT